MSTFASLSSGVFPTRNEVCYQVGTGPILQGFEVVYYEGEEELNREIEDLTGAVVAGAVVVACPVTNDYEYMIRCSPDDNAPIAVVLTFDGAGTPTVSYYDLTNDAPYTGTLPLISCQGVDYEFVPQTVCDEKLRTLTQYSVVDPTDPTNPSVLGTFYLEADGSVTTPAGNVTIGACGIEKKQLAHFVRRDAGDTWNSSADVPAGEILKSVTLVAARANNNNVILVTDVDGTQTKLTDRGTYTWSAEDGANRFVLTELTFEFGGNSRGYVQFVTE